MKEIEGLTNEPLVHAPDVEGVVHTTMEELSGVADKVKAEEAASTQPCEGLHRSKGVFGSSSVEEATVVVKEECFEVDDALSLPAQGKPLDSDLDDMEESSTIALEEMEKAAALVEDSYESEFNKPIDNSKSEEPATRSPTIDGGVAYSTVEELNGLADKVKTEEAVPTQPYE